MNTLALAALSGLLAAGQADPDFDNPQAQEMVNKLFAPMIEDAVNSMGRQMEMNRRLNGQIVAEAKFQGASLADVVAFIKNTSKDLDANGRPLNLVVVPAATEAAKGRTVDLDLKSVPLGAVLRYSMAMLGLSYQVEEHAIMITPPQPAPQVPVQMPGRPVQPATPVR